MVRFLFPLLMGMLFFSNTMVKGELPIKFEKLIEKGEYSAAQVAMRQELATNLELDPKIRMKIEFEIERLERIKQDFSRTLEEILPMIREYYPTVSEAQIKQWETEKSLESRVIDGQKRYFKWAANNLFRIDKAAKKQKKRVERKKGIHKTDVAGFSMKRYSKILIEKAQPAISPYFAPKRFQITYTLTVPPNTVPENEILRCWLAFPREKAPRQTDIKVIKTVPENYILADNSHLQRTIYFEKPAVVDQPTQFQVVFQYTAQARFEVVDPTKIEPLSDPDALAAFLAERPPHIVFTEELKTLAKQIVGNEKNPYLKAKKIFEWISENIPWASAREYSTIRNISQYCYQNMHGDCGIQTLLFMTLARISGIPTKWQSGWTTMPQEYGMHDWGEMYFEPYGWLPVDQSNGLQDSEDETVKWYFFGNIDHYRLVVNDDYSRPLFPAKMHPRSETVDFQRGEVEWRGGNLYFDQWDWDYKVDYLD